MYPLIVIVMSAISNQLYYDDPFKSNASYFIIWTHDVRLDVSGTTVEVEPYHQLYIILILLIIDSS